jgi:hypothetical protein
VYPEDRVLIAYMPEPADFARASEEGWYRLPQQHAPKGLYAEYYAFYFGRKFGDRKWAIHHYARQTGFELLRRVDLLPEEPDHPRAQALYYRVALDPMLTLAQPIVSLRWRRIAFMHTTWDRFQEAREINDLLLNGGEYVDRLYATLKERGITAKRNYEVKEPGGRYKVPLVVLSGQRLLEIYEGDAPASDAGRERLADRIERGLAGSQ